MLKYSNYFCLCRYGKPKHTDLMREDDSGDEREIPDPFRQPKPKPKKKWRKEEAT